MKQFLALSGGKDSMACLFLMKDKLDGAIYVDTGYSYPDTHAMIALAETLLPVHRVLVDRDATIRRNGLPSDVVPVEWTPTGQAMTGPKPYYIQASLQCCFDNLSRPLLDKAKSLGATHIVYGQRNEETHKSPSRDGVVFEGMTRVHPIEQWTREDVLLFLKQHMEIPNHFYLTRSSLDCYDCPAYQRVSKDLHRWTKEHYPAYFAAYAEQYNAILAAVEASL